MNIWSSKFLNHNGGVVSEDNMPFSRKCHKLSLKMAIPNGGHPDFMGFFPLVS